MVIVLSIYLLAIFIFVFPFPMDLNTFFSLDRKRAGSNFRLGFYTIDISVAVGANGVEIYGLKPEESKVVTTNKKRMELFYHPRILESVTIDAVDIVFQYGNSRDAFNTCMVCSAIDNFSTQVHRALFSKINSFRKIIIPEFEKDSLFFQLRIDIKINLFIIFSTLFKIILLKLAKRFRLKGGLNE